MYSRFKIYDPGQVEVTLSLTMKISEWRSLRDQILASPDRNDHPSWRIINKVKEMIDSAHKHFETEFEGDD